MPEGEYLLVFAAYGDDIELADTERLYQYAVVFDADGDTTNNYVPDPAFENDFFRDSDRWYEATYSPSEGWKLKVTDARNNNFTEIASAARVIISENAFVLVVPASEFSVPQHRFTRCSLPRERWCSAPMAWPVGRQRSTRCSMASVSCFCSPFCGS